MVRGLPPLRRPTGPASVPVRTVIQLLDGHITTPIHGVTVEMLASLHRWQARATQEYATMAAEAEVRAHEAATYIKELEDSMQERVQQAAQSIAALFPKWDTKTEAGVQAIIDIGGVCAPLNQREVAALGRALGSDIKNIGPSSDIKNIGPEFTVTNRRVAVALHQSGLTAEQVLAAGGVTAVWNARNNPEKLAEWRAVYSFGRVQESCTPDEVAQLRARIAELEAELAARSKDDPEVIPGVPDDVIKAIDAALLTNNGNLYSNAGGLDNTLPGRIHNLLHCPDVFGALRATPTSNADVDALRRMVRGFIKLVGATTRSDPTALDRRLIELNGMLSATRRLVRNAP